MKLVIAGAANAYSRALLALASHRIVFTGTLPPQRFTLYCSTRPSSHLSRVFPGLFHRLRWARRGTTGCEGRPLRSRRLAAR
jgi:hypothetical protein